MTTILCGSIGCKYHGDGNVCQCEKVLLNERYAHTMFDGLGHFWKCMSFEESDEVKLLEKMFFKSEGETNAWNTF